MMILNNQFNRQQDISIKVVVANLRSRVVLYCLQEKKKILGKDATTYRSTLIKDAEYIGQHTQDATLKVHAQYTIEAYSEE